MMDSKTDDREIHGAPDEGAPSVDDPIVAEVRASREAIFAEAGFDLEELGRMLRSRQAAAGRVGVVLSPRPPSKAA